MGFLWFVAGLVSGWAIFLLTLYIRSGGTIGQMGIVIAFCLGALFGGLVGWGISFMWDYYDLEQLKKELEEVRKSTDQYFLYFGDLLLSFSFGG